MTASPDRSRPPAERRSPLSHAARWVGATNVALLALILWVEAGSLLGQGWVMIGAAATVAVWAAFTVSLLLAWLVPDRVPAWVDLARASQERGRDRHR